MKHLAKINFPRNKSNLALQNGKERYWKEEKLTQNNRSVYTLIKKINVNNPSKSDKSFFRSSGTDPTERHEPYK